MSELAAARTDYDVVEGEPPELMGRNLTSAAHLVASATAFFFLAFFFAYFYLRSLNNADLWQPKDVEPSITSGTLVMALTVLSAVSSGSASPTSAPVAGRSGGSRAPSRSASGSVRSCCRSSSGSPSASGRRTAATRASSSAGRRSTSSSSQDAALAREPSGHRDPVSDDLCR